MKIVFVFIGGASGSGKTRLAESLVKQLKDRGDEAECISLDHYYKTKAARAHLTGTLGFDEPEAYDFKLFHEQLRQLNEGKTIERPTYSKVPGVQDRTSEVVPINPQGVKIIVVEGILALHQINQLRLDYKIPVFISSNSYIDYAMQRGTRDKIALDRGDTKARYWELKKGGVRDGFFNHIIQTKNSACIQLTNNRCHEQDIQITLDELIKTKLMPVIEEKLATVTSSVSLGLASM